jgi:hypothetical protein
MYTCLIISHCKSPWHIFSRYLYYLAKLPAIISNIYEASSKQESLCLCFWNKSLEMTCFICNNIILS